MECNNHVENVHNNMADHVIQIEEKLGKLPPTSHVKNIFKVPNRLRMVKKEAYEPQYVGIGPYHYNKEEQNIYYLKQMLGRSSQNSVGTYVNALRGIEEEIRQNYDEIDTVPHKKFIEIMLLDGCFILEYMMYMCRSEKDDPLFSVDWICCCIKSDLLLLENQLPFKVLTTLYDLTKDDDRHPDLISMVQKVFGCEVDPRPLQCRYCYNHLLDIVYHKRYSRTSETTSSTMLCSCASIGIIKINGRKKGTRKKEKEKPKLWAFLIPSAKELEESGIKFSSEGNSAKLSDIEFDNGTLKIPPITIDDNTESLLRNLVAYEQQCRSGKINDVIEYVHFLDCLISTPKDVELLRQNKIITNLLGDDEVVSKIFNRIGDNVVVSSNCNYESVYIEVNEHRSKRRNRWMAKLKRDYFHSPWSIISVLAAIVLLLLTLIQTVYTVTSSYKKD